MGKAVINLAAKGPVLPDFPSYGIAILESHHARDFTMPPSAYDFAELMLILEGEGALVKGRTRHPVRPGNVIAMPRDTTYQYEDTSEKSLGMFSLCLRPHGSLLEVFRAALPVSFQIFRHQGLSREAAAHFRAILLAQVYDHPDTAATVVSESLQLLGKINRQIRHSHPKDPAGTPAGLEPDFVARMTSYIDQLQGTFHATDTMDSAASSLGMSRRTFSHYFKKLAGMSHLAYIRRLRVQHACLLLETESRSVTAIAFACGYQDLSSFLRAFRRECGLNPSEWRQQRAPKNKRLPTHRPR
jgi:AraC-like DNA-binding protein